MATYNFKYTQEELAILNLYPETEITSKNFNDFDEKTRFAILVRQCYDYGLHWNAVRLFAAGLANNGIYVRKLGYNRYDKGRRDIYVLDENGISGYAYGVNPGRVRTILTILTTEGLEDKIDSSVLENYIHNGYMTRRGLFRCDWPYDENKQYDFVREVKRGWDDSTFKVGYFLVDYDGNSTKRMDRISLSHFYNTDSGKAAHDWRVSFRNR